MDASTNNSNGSLRPMSRSCEVAAAALTKEDWIQLYTGRILRVWFHHEAPLGLAGTYANWIRRDLARSYTQPLVRAFIEETYRRT
jgi:hypothetical protein